MPSKPDFPHGWLDNLTTPPLGFVVWSTHLHDVSMPALHAHPEHELNLILHGNGHYRDDSGTLHSFHEGDIVFLPAGCDHRIDVPGETRFLIFLLHPDRFAQLPIDDSMHTVQTYQTPYILRDARAFRILRQLHAYACQEQAGHSPEQDAIMEHLAQLVALECLRCLAGEADAVVPDAVQLRIQTVVDWLEQNLHETITLPQLAQMACLSPSQFSTRFRKETGSSPMAYVKQLRLSQAAFLLRQTRLPVLEIALCAGYKDLSHFNHQFRAQYRKSPTAYRKNAQ